jgi:hypothetical protein
MPAHDICATSQCPATTTSVSLTAVSLPTAPPLLEGCGRTLSATSHGTNDDSPAPRHRQQQPPRATSPDKNTPHQTPRHKDRGSEERRKGSRRGKEEGERERKEKLRVGRKAVWIPHAASFNLPDASEAVCNPHTISFDLPDTNEVVWIPHAVLFDLPNTNKAVWIPHATLFGLPDANEQCATHTPLRSSFFIPLSFGGDSFQ